MKLRIVEPGWQTFTGNFGGVDFVNGETEEASPRQAQMIANLIRVETFEGKNPSTTQMVLESRAIPMDQELVRNADTGEFAKGSDVAQSPVVAVKKWTVAELEEVVAKDGINGLRAIAEPLQLKGRSIAELVEAIVKAGEAAPDVPTWGVDKAGDPIGGDEMDRQRRAEPVVITPVEEIKD